MSQADSRREPLVLRRSTTTLTMDLLIAAVLLFAAAIGGAVADRAPWSGPVHLVALVAAAILMVFRFPRTAPDDSREEVYVAGRVGRLVGIRDGFAGLGRFAGLRMLAVAVVLFRAAAHYVGGPGRAGSVAGMVCAGLAAAGLVLTIAAEPFLVRLLRLPAPYAVRLPGLPVLPDRTGYAWLPAHVSILATVVAAACAVLGAPGWLLLVIAVLGTMPTLGLIGQVRARRRIAGRIRSALPGAIGAYAPEFVLYTSRPDDASYQLTMWLPYLQRAGRPFLIVTRHELPAEAVAPQVNVPVVCCRGISDLELILTDSLRAAFYVNASSGNGSLIRYHQLTHVYLGHGDSDKPPSYNPTHAMYDRIFTAGPAANRRYGDHGVLMDPGKFCVVGRPQVEVVQQPTPERVADRTAGARPVILYAPTWKGHVTETALSSLDRAESIVGALLDRDADVIFRPHPFSYDDVEDAAIIGRVKQLLAEDARRSHRRHRYGRAAETELDAFGCMNAADAMISDVSSVVSDFLQSGKPFAMIAPPDLDPERFVTDYPVARAGYLVDHDLRALPDVLNDLLVPSDDRLAARRAEVRADYLGDFPVEGYADHFVQAVRDACDNPAPRMAEVSESDDGSTTVSRDTIRRNLSSVARTMSSGLAAVGALTAALEGAVLAGLVTATIALLVAGVTLAGQRRAPNGPTLEGTRMILVLAAATILARDALPGPVSILVLLPILGIAAEPVIHAAWTYPGVVASNLPGLRVPVRGRRFWMLLLFPAVIGWLGWLPPVAGMDSGIGVLIAALVVVACYLVAVAVNVVRSRARLGAAATAESAVPEVLREYAPEFCVYFGSGIGADYQVGMWLPYFRRLQRPFLIVTRSLPMHQEIVALTAGTGIPVLLRPTLRSLEDIVVPTMRVAFYVNNAVRNTHLIERRQLTHVWLNHGDSEKPACYNPVHAIYDRIFTAGQAGIDRYARHNVIIPAAKFTIVGRPQTEAITAARGPISRIERPTVLYAPTWQGPYADSRVYSLPVGLPIIDALLDRGVRVIFRAHPFNYRYPGARKFIEAIGARLEADRSRTGTEHLWGAEAETKLSVEDCFNASDAMICDVSAVISDYLAAAKPFAVVAVGRTEDELLAEAPAAAAGYPIADDLSNLAEALDRLLVSDPKADERDRMRRYYLGDLPNERAAEGFLAASIELLDAPRRDAESSERGSVPA